MFFAGNHLPVAALSALLVYTTARGFSPAGCTVLRWRWQLGRCAFCIVMSVVAPTLIARYIEQIGPKNSGYTRKCVCRLLLISHIYTGRQARGFHMVCCELPPSRQKSKCPSVHSSNSGCRTADACGAILINQERSAGGSRLSVRSQLSERERGIDRRSFCTPLVSSWSGRMTRPVRSSGLTPAYV